MVAKTSVAILLSCVIAVSSATAQSADPAPVKPLAQAHAHNDYLHDRPLLDALDQGFCSVEADVFLVDGKLLVAHTKYELKPNRTLQSLYLDPLRERVRSNDGSVYAKKVPFMLLIDIKSEGEATYRAISDVLEEYDEVFTHVVGDQVKERAVTAVISGNRPIDFMTGQSKRWAGIDGRLSDLDSESPAHLLPLISDHWGRNFRWRGVGDIYAEDLQKLRRIVRQAHQKKRKVRFWAIPDRQVVWEVLRDEGVDLINTDQLSELSEFLREKKVEK